ncbi:oligouridylate-binding protein 1-like [Iris pallida]|uniref:Oligouridylate-binding protein 1-like n=1 Tax=Iris pallida TaxID=29817 RepID=A0AAX6E5H8_IRIPA|nr:oligouridylate-binding protein 1-like [Iris pallida]
MADLVFSDCHLNVPCRRWCILGVFSCTLCHLESKWRTLKRKSFHPFLESTQSEGTSKFTEISTTWLDCTCESKASILTVKLRESYQQWTGPLICFDQATVSNRSFALGAVSPLHLGLALLLSLTFCTPLHWYLSK